MLPGALPLRARCGQSTNAHQLDSPSGATRGSSLNSGEGPAVRGPSPCTHIHRSSVQWSAVPASDTSLTFRGRIQHTDPPLKTALRS